MPQMSPICALYILHSSYFANFVIQVIPTELVDFVFTHAYASSSFGDLLALGLVCWQWHQSFRRVSWAEMKASNTVERLQANNTLTVGAMSAKFPSFDVRLVIFRTSSAHFQAFGLYISSVGLVKCSITFNTSFPSQTSTQSPVYV
jgi:hypothetical protein